MSVEYLNFASSKFTDRTDRKEVVAILGYGTVGRSLYKILEDKEIFVKYIAKRNLKGLTEEEELKVACIDKIVSDNKITTVFECMGGVDAAYDAVKKALLNEKNVITANKDLIAKHGKELFDIAYSRGVKLLISASVGGRIPVLRNLQAGVFTKVVSICNGTQNYILTRMDEGASFEEALCEAQEKGFAELNPKSDVESIDAARKTLIIANIMSNKARMLEEVTKEGLEGVTKEKMKLAKYLGAKVKIVSIVSSRGDMRVTPHIVFDKDLKNCKYEENVFILANEYGTFSLKGPGAGGFPTANNMFEDYYTLLKNKANVIRWENADDKKTISISKVAFIIGKDNNSKGNLKEICRILNVSSVQQTPESFFVFSDNYLEEKQKEKIVKALETLDISVQTIDYI